MTKENYLIYIDPVGKNSEGLYEYDFFFTEDPESVWGEDWAEQCPSACSDMEPSGEFKKVRVTCDIPFGVAQKNSCFSMQDCIEGIIALAWEDVREYEDYPEPYRIVIRFGESYENVFYKLDSRGIKIESPDDYLELDEPEEESPKEPLEF